MRSLTVRTSLVALLLAVSACSGSGDDSSAEPTAPAKPSATPQTPKPSATGEPPSVAPVDLPPCDSARYSPDQAGSRNPSEAVRRWGVQDHKGVPPVPRDGWQQLDADGGAATMMTNPTAPVWIVEVSRTSGGGWAVTRASWGLCH